jgi:hypothetical protein
LIFSAFTPAQQTKVESNQAIAESQTSGQKQDSVVNIRQTENARRRLLLLKINQRLGKLSREQRQMLKPAPEDFLANSAFLKQSGTGLVKLFPDPQCNEIIVNVKDEKCLNAFPIPGHGSFYSFRKKSYTDAYWWDIHFVDNSFAVDFKNNSLLIADLGNVPLEAVDSAAVRELKDVPLIKISVGSQIKGEKYPGRIPARKNTTYAVRSVTYKGMRNPEALFKYNEVKLFYDDAITVFRIIRQNPDSSIIILWKRLLR